MEIQGLPGSLKELLDRLPKEFPRPETFAGIPMDIDSRDIACFLETIRHQYETEFRPYDLWLEAGAKGEYHLAAELGFLLSDIEGTLFNNPEFSLEKPGPRGAVVTYNPDQLILTHCHFGYVETKRWDVTSRQTVEDALSQMDAKLRAVTDYLAQLKIVSKPTPFLYDANGVFPEEGRFPVIRYPKELAKKIRLAENDGLLPDYEPLAAILQGLIPRRDCPTTNLINRP